MKRSIATVFFLTALISAFGANATQTITPEERAKVEEYFQQSMGGEFTASSVEVKESDIDGLVEIYFQGRLMYFNVKNKLLFIGEIYNEHGVSLTKAAIQQRAYERLASLPNIALVLNGGKGLKKIIEFSDPDCPFCRRANDFFTQAENAVERHVYFDTRIHPQARPKVIHILCAEDREKAFQDVYTERLATYDYCEEGAELADLHQKASVEMSVSATPTFFIEGNLVRGFNRQMLADFLNSRN
jgi:thiol:disulfide interchange protein DsbC